MNWPKEALQQLDDFIEAYEAACEEGKVAALSAFAPRRDHPDYAATVVELVRVDMERRWRDGRRKAISAYQQEFPHVLMGAHHLGEVAFEEYRLRRLAGEAVSRDEYHTRYSIGTNDWPELPLGDGSSDSASADCGSSWFRALSASDPQSAHRLAAAARQMPSVGDRFAGFELIGELGRGAFGRVYLARQGDLANRFVVLKVTAQLSEEPQRLAQLQHTNIVPIYSLHKHGRLQAVCMPFLGPNTLADLLQTFQVNHSIPASGKALVSTLAARQASTVVKQTTHGALDEPWEPDSPTHAHLGETIHRLGNMSYRDAAAWIIARVADGLAFAHEHGIVHRDLKPANILLTDDGEPLILDFNLSSQTSPLGSSSMVVGGTLPYMAPEHIEASRHGGEVGPHSDIYSLGVILFEMLTGQTPYPIRRGPFMQLTSEMLEDRKLPAPPVSRLNKTVSPDLETIVARCLAIEPNDRYATARQVHEDLQCHLDNRPLRHAPSRSLQERTRKWARRHPRLSSGASIATLAIVVIVALAGAWWFRSAQVARFEAYDQWRQLQSVVADARTALNTPYVDQPILDASVTAAAQALAHYGLMRSGELARAPDYHRLDTLDRERFRHDAAELLYLLASGKGQQAVRAAEEDRPRLFDEALVLNEVAQEVLRSDSVSQALLLQRARLLQGGGRPEEAETVRERAAQSAGPDLRNRRILAFETAQQHNPEHAAQLIQELIQEAPQDYALWFSLGNCYLDVHRFAEAEGCFSTAIALRREFTLGYDHRGLARLNLNRPEEARADFDVVLARRPGLSASLVNRALAYKALAQPEKAMQDLTLALENGATQTRIYFIRSRLKAELGDKSGAAADRAEGLRLTPRDELSWIARGVARLKDDPAGALADFREAVKLNPRSQAAWQNVAHVLSERLGKTDEAVAAMDQLVAIQPNDAGARVSRGVLFARLGKRDAAVADAEQALSASEMPLIVYQAGCIYSLTSRQRREDAIRAVQLVARALQRDASLVNVAVRDPDLTPIRDQAVLRETLSAARILLQHASASFPAP